MHTDCNQEQGVLVYPYFRGTLLGLMKDDPPLSDAERKKILRGVAEAIGELHAKDWIHIGMYIPLFYAPTIKTWCLASSNPFPMEPKT